MWHRYKDGDAVHFSRMCFDFVNISMWWMHDHGAALEPSSIEVPLVARDYLYVFATKMYARDVLAKPMPLLNKYLESQIQFDLNLCTCTLSCRLEPERKQRRQPNLKLNSVIERRRLLRYFRAWRFGEEALAKSFVFAQPLLQMMMGVLQVTPPPRAGTA